MFHASRSNLGSIVYVYYQQDACRHTPVFRLLGRFFKVFWPPYVRHVALIGVMKCGVFDSSAEFHPVGAGCGVEPQTMKHFAQFWNINTAQGHIPCIKFTKFLAFVGSFGSD